VCRQEKIVFGLSCAPEDGYVWRITGPQHRSGTFTPGNTTAEVELEKPGTYTVEVRDGGFEGQDNLVRRKLSFHVVSLEEIRAHNPTPSYIPPGSRLDEGVKSQPDAVVYSTRKPTR